MQTIELQRSWKYEIAFIGQDCASKFDGDEMSEWANFKAKRVEC